MTGLSLFDFPIQRLPASEAKVPNLGWLPIHVEKESNHFVDHVLHGRDFYFVHSYALQSKEIKQIFANTNFSQKIPAIIGKENYIGVQFHPEKSGNSGQKFIYNWLKWRP